MASEPRTKQPKQILPDLPGQVISVEDLKKTEEVAEHFYEVIERKRSEHALREFISKKVTGAFLIINFTMLGLIAVIYAMDTYLLISGISSERLIDTKVIMTLIGATTVQLGTFMLGIGAWLFPKLKDKKG